ncbi:hypothetical protein PV04_08960 [Phialophora macrospora]|uniref:Uncharacterized protein n=1 Tax=Phialophora macrospora TaxID=1851006 RepID=A0A0D2FB10_9EURO|nr:hypothetical protein PV04_08960 [Phialophora macrospora]
MKVRERTYRFESEAHRDRVLLLACEDRVNDKEVYMENLKKTDPMKYHELGLHYEKIDYKIDHDAFLRHGAVLVTSQDE